MSVTVTAPAVSTVTVTSNAAAATVATASTTGTAKFNTDNFAISGAGDVTIKDAGVLLTAEVTGTLPIANGGTGATAAAMVGIITAADASAARTVLELVPGTSANQIVQMTAAGKLPAVDGSDLTNLAASPTYGISNTNAVKVDSASVADDEYARFTASGLESRSTAEVLSDIGAQPVNAGLTAIAGLTSAANKGIQFTGSGTAAVYTLTAAGKALLDDADAATQRQTLGLSTAAVLAAGTGSNNVVQLSALGALPAVSGSALTGLNAGNFTTGTLAVARGGTGLTSISTLLNSNTTKSDVGLSAVENTALTTWAGSESITTTGTVGTGVWNATAILDTKIDLRVDHGVTFDGGGSVIESGKVVYVPVERAGVIKAATLVADASGAITITITRYDPDADATTLGGSAAVGSIALATKIINRDTTLSGWTLAVAEGDVLAFTTGGTIATVTRVTCKLKVELA
jgi:hypothetical protein